MIQLYHKQIVSFKTYHQPCSGTWFKRLCQLRQENSPPNKQWNLICADVTLFIQTILFLLETLSNHMPSIGVSLMCMSASRRGDQNLI